MELLSHVVTQHFEHCASALNLEKSVCVDLMRYWTFKGRAAWGEYFIKNLPTLVKVSSGKHVGF